MSDEEVKRLAGTVSERLNYFTEKNAISFEDYIAGKGKDYRNKPCLQVYGKDGEPCPICKMPFRRIIIGGRSSCFCPNCQK